MIGTKSFAMTVMLWPSIVNFWIPSAPALINRSRCFRPGVKWNLLIPALLTQGVLFLAGSEEQLKLFLPLIRLLTEGGA
jgi:hypothetical protein